MSESTSSPSVSVHPVSPSSSLSSTDSAPRSEPTSDEQPDLGFNELLREYSHLQPHHRIPIQIRSATSSTTPTYHAESVTGTDFRIRSGRGNSRGTPSVLSTVSTFTRPPTSSLQPDGSTVWANPLIAPYLPSNTPSNETFPEEEEEEEEEDYLSSESASRASTALTVEIRDIRSLDDGSHDLDPDEFSPEPISSIPIPVESAHQQLDSLETPNTEDDIDSLSSHNQRGDSSITSRDIIRRTVTSSSHEQSDNSMQLQSQVLPAASMFTSTSSLSFTSSDDVNVSVSIADPSASSSINTHVDRTVGAATSSESTSTLMNVYLNRSGNPIPSRTISDSSYPTTRALSSSFSLISYQLSEAPSVTDIRHEESDPEMASDRPEHSDGSHSISSATSNFSRISTQRSSGFSSSRSTALPQRLFHSRSHFSISVTDSSLPNPHSLFAATPLTNPHSLSAASPLTNPHSLPAESPLINPYSSAATPEDPPTANDQLLSAVLGNTVDNLATPDQPPSEAILYEPSRLIFEPIHDEEDDPGSRQSPMHLQASSGIQQNNYNHRNTGESYPGGRTPRYLSGRTPKDIPTISTNSTTRDSQTSDTVRLSGETNQGRHLTSQNGRLELAVPIVVSGTETVETSIQSHPDPYLQMRRQRSLVDLPSGSSGFDGNLSHQSTSHLTERLPTQAYPSSPVGLHLLPSEPLRALAVPLSGRPSPKNENNAFSSGTQFLLSGHEADPEAEQLYVEATTSQTRLLPSLGYLDEALSFIASERVRLTAARTTVGSSTGGASSSKEQPGRESEREDWKDAFGAELGGELKRKRRRKRPSKPSVQLVSPESSPAKDKSAAHDPQRHPEGSIDSPKKRRSKSAAPSLSSSASILSLTSTKSGSVTPGRRKDRRKGKEFLILPPPPPSGDPRLNAADSDLDDGERTPTNVPVPGIIRVSNLLGMNPTGVKSKRIGRREREKFQFESKARNHKSSDDPDFFDDPIDIGVEYGPNTDNNDNAELIEETGEGPGENDSISNMSLLQPPRRLRSQGKIKSGETSFSLITKDLPTTSTGQSSINFHEEEIKNINPYVIAGAEDFFPLKDVASDEKEKKRTRPQPLKEIAHSQSHAIPSVDAEAFDNTQCRSTTNDRGDKNLERNRGSELSELQNQGQHAPSNSKQSRLLALAQSLQRWFPEQQEELSVITKRVAKHGMQKDVLSPDTASSSERGSGTSMPIPVPSKGKTARKGHFRIASEGAVTTGPDSFEARHFGTVKDLEEGEEEDIDPRGRSPKKKDPLIHVFIDHSNILIGLLSHLRRPTPFRKRSYLARRKPLPAVVTNVTTQAKVIPVAAVPVIKPTNSRPLPTLPESSSSPRDFPIPLPSFATLPRSLPSVSILSSRNDPNSPEEFERHIAANSDGYDGSGIEDGHGSSGNSGSALTWQKEKKPSKHLWHAAFILILERGRPITRRVVVASSPLYQPMESIERFGYDLRVFIRVPDLGDGMDREHNMEKGRSGKTNHTKRISGSESGSGSNAKSNLGTPSAKIKFREQGVDELLQLKLHQAIAASDEVPDGSTIILATGDGNMGQFNEEGFLGPIRTALRRGWKVELYAWEGGLSRAWKREFGEDTEWGKRGRFRIIEMERFATWLVEAPEWA